MNSHLRRLGQWLLWLAAANFAALLVMVVALSLAGAVELESWRGAVNVLRGTSVSMPVDEVEQLRTLEWEIAERRAIPAEKVLLKSWRKLRAERWQLRRQAAEQWARLALLASFVDGERDKLVDRQSEFRAEVAQQNEARNRRQQQLEQVASDKLKRLYNYMRPASIAADLENRMESGDKGRNEVAQIVKTMTERSAAEVLEAFEDPAKRNQVYDLMAGRNMPNAEATP